MIYVAAGLAFAILAVLVKGILVMSALTDAVTANTALVQSVATYVKSLPPSDAAEVAAAVAQLQQNNAALAAIVPAAPATSPTSAT